MGGKRLTPIVTALFGVTLALEVASVILSWGLEPRWDTIIYAIYAIVMAGAGALIVSRHPGHVIGSLLLAGALWNALLADAAQGWVLRAAEEGWPGGPAGEWLATASWLPSGLGWILTFLLLPDGKLLGPRWRAVVWAAAIGTPVALVGWSLDPDTGSEFVAGRNPLAVDALPTDALLAVGMTLFLGALVASVVSFVLRFRRSTGVERQQLKWFAYAASIAAIVLPIGFVLWSIVPVVRAVIAVVLTGLPVAVCISVLRYRLYDIDAVIRRTLVYAALTAALAGIYGLTALVLGTSIGRHSAWTTAGATLAAAAAFSPLRRRLQDVVDHRFNPARYDALRRISTWELYRLCRSRTKLSPA